MAVVQGGSTRPTHVHTARLLRHSAIVLGLATLLLGCQKKEETTPEASTETMGGAEVAAKAGATAANPQRNAYFGELHLHTSWSFDAYSFQNRSIDPDAAYRYAKSGT